MLAGSEIPQGTFYEDYAATSKDGLKLIEHNNQFAINKFLHGKWEGKCENIKAEKIVLDFQADVPRVFYWFYTSQPSKDMMNNADLYEIVDENTLRLPLRRPENQVPIKIEKLGEDKIRFSGELTPDCVFTRSKE